MIKLIIGGKGQGKTKQLLAAVQDALAEDKGSVVFINKGDRHVYDLSSKVRLINSEEYSISSYGEFYGFMCGIISQNFDITHIFADSITKITGSDSTECIDKFLAEAAAICEQFGITFYATISMEQDLATATMKEYMI